MEENEPRYCKQLYTFRNAEDVKMAMHNIQIQEAKDADEIFEITEHKEEIVKLIKQKEKLKMQLEVMYTRVHS